MRFGGSLVLIALGAILRWAVTYRVAGVNMSTVGTILLVVGILGLVVTAVLWSTNRRTDVVHERDVVGDPRV